MNRNGLTAHSRYTIRNRMLGFIMVLIIAIIAMILLVVSIQMAEAARKNDKVIETLSAEIFKSLLISQEYIPSREGLTDRNSSNTFLGTQDYLKIDSNQTAFFPIFPQLFGP